MSPEVQVGGSVRALNFGMCSDGLIFFYEISLDVGLLFSLNIFTYRVDSGNVDPSANMDP